MKGASLILDKFEKFSNYDEQTSYQQIVFAHDTGILETELNEMQQLQSNAHTNMVRKTIYSGFTELVQKEFTGESIVYNPTENGLTLVNKIAIAPFRAFVNGYEIDGQGNFTYNKLDNYILIDLGKPSKDSIDDTLVYLEVWFEIAKGEDQAKKCGYNEGDNIGTPALDSRVAHETSRRIVLHWNVRVANECAFDIYPEGLGYKDITHFSHVFARVNGQFGNVDNVNAAFCEATNNLFKNELFHFDKNLYVAGRKDYDINSSTLYGRYVFALPMFRIRRRNSSKFTIANFNGAPSYNEMIVVNDSSKNGDLLNNMRPDRLAYDVINANDVMDLRKSVNFSDFNENSLGDYTLKKLLNNQLTTHETKKMRRVQFGNKHMNHEDIPSATLIIPFDKSMIPEKPVFDINNPITLKTDLRYEDSICKFGAVIEGTKQLSYKIHNSETDYLLTAKQGCMDFYLKPFWNGNDTTVSQVIISLVNESDSPILKLQKKGNQLIFSQFNYEELNSDYVENQAIVDLTSELLKANQYYHFRLSWTEEPMPTNGQIYLYINGNLKAQTDCSACHLVARTLKIGSSSNTSDKGFLIEEFIGYNKNFETLSLQGTMYGYAKNRFWPMIPYDFINAETLLMPSFNGVVNNYSDNAYVQKDTVFHLKYDESVNLKTFYINLCSDKIVRSIDNVYDLKGKTVTGVWTGLGTNACVFKTYDQTIEQIVVTATIELSSGCGGQDVATEILSAAIVKYDEEADNYDYNLNLSEEVSFNDINNEHPRQTPLLKPRKVAGNEDSAYDFTNKYRTQKQCYARLIYYNVSGDGTNQYKIPMHLYGYKVAGIVGCGNKKITKVTKTPSDIVGEEDLYFTVYLETALLVGETVVFEIATEGLSFDYDLNSKTLVTNVCKCKVLEFAADGINSKFTIPCLTLSQEGSIHGGILKSVFTFTDNTLDANGDVTDVHNEYIQCYQDGEIFYDEHGKPTDKRLFNTQNIKVLDSSFGTPFITVVFDEGEKPRKDTVIQIPIVVSYQLTDEDMLSLWYNYVPYQGVLDATVHDVHRITDWKYFITTLGTGKTNDEKIKVNIINNLPGGLTYGYKIDNKDIVLMNTFNNMSQTLSQEDINKRLVFLQDYVLKNDADFCNLVTNYKIVKNCKQFQDGNIEFKNVNFNLYFDDCKTSINKYVGAYCVVALDNGELMLFVISNVDMNSTVINKLSPQYGDLYKIEGRPTTIRS